MLQYLSHRQERDARENDMSYAEILATDPNFTWTGVEDFASFMAPEDGARFLAQVAEIRNSL